ncbi:MAG: DegT/DnrJ/EryC1/StrS family aminotransferase [Candidatus Hydrogenedentes bacterium]|nr:DegT/DnrJ/EryC1/StrS family aminotransferase [Candidatus Hydrogenedentota bacterium]
MSELSSPLAVHGGTPLRPASKPWPKWPQISETDIAAVCGLLESGAWWYGPWVKRFETDYAQFVGAAQAVSVNSGTAAAEIVLQAMGIGPGDEVIVPPYTFFATASTVMRMGARPVFVDIDASWCMNPDLVEAAITPRTKAIMPVHFSGRICDMDRIMALARKHGLKVIEDACHAWGASWKGTGAGALGDAAVFSFQHSKNITAGEGGAITTNDEALADLCRSLTHSGRVMVNGNLEFHYAGTNARITEIQAAMLCGQLDRLEPQTQRRLETAPLLDAALETIDGLTPQPGDVRITRRAYHLYCIRFDAEAVGCTREQFIAACVAEGLPLRAGYTLPLYDQPLFQECRDYDYSLCNCPVTEDLCASGGMWLPHALLLGNDEDIQDIIAILRKVAGHARAL